LQDHERVGQAGGVSMMSSTSEYGTPKGEPTLVTKCVQAVGHGLSGAEQQDAQGKRESLYEGAP